MSGPVYWNGQELPPKKPGHVWAIRMWPGGRKVLDQLWFHEMHYADEAAKRQLAEESSEAKPLGPRYIRTG